jgi:hypothetical protein
MISDYETQKHDGLEAESDDSTYGNVAAQH